jgi:protein-ribulosamine 3-kinase
VTSSHFLEAELRTALGDPGLRITSVHPVSGGCIHKTAHLETTKGDFFAKWNAEGPPEVFVREAEALRALRAAGSSLLVPEVLLASTPRDSRPGFIVMEYLSPARGPGGTEPSTLGRGLAEVHRHRAEGFGFPVTTYCGPTPQDNTWTSSWVDFFAERRILALVRALEREDRLAAAEQRLLERLADRLPTFLPHETVPSLVHGDLWSGNVLHTVRGPALVDPACAYADREMEFGITTLFGGFPDRFFTAYEEAWPLPLGWRERNPLYQLYHLLNHFLIFGGTYGAQALSLARRYV